MLVVPTIPHTGTHLVAGLFNKFQIAFNDRPEGDSIFVGHIVKLSQVLQAVERLKDFPGVVPLRHPYVVWESWKLRGMDFKPFTEAWMNLIEYIDTFEPSYIPIDFNRDFYLQKMNQKLNLNIQTDWPVYSVKGTHNLDYKDIVPDENLKSFTKDIGSFIGRFYVK